MPTLGLYRGDDAALYADLGLLGAAQNSWSDHEQRLPRRCGTPGMNAVLKSKMRLDVGGGKNANWVFE